MDAEVTPQLVREWTHRFLACSCGPPGNTGVVQAYLDRCEEVCRRGANPDASEQSRQHGAAKGICSGGRFPTSRIACSALSSGERAKDRNFNLVIKSDYAKSEDPVRMDFIRVESGHPAESERLPGGDRSISVTLEIELHKEFHELTMATAFIRRGGDVFTLQRMESAHVDRQRKHKQYAKLLPLY